METIKKAFEENNVAIFLASSDLYAPYVGVVVESIVQNSSLDKNYDILVLETDITLRNKKLMKKIVEDHSNVSLRFIDISEMVDKYIFQTSGRHAKYNYYRLTAPEVLSEYEKVVYLDSDLVVNHDIADLYEVNLEGKFVAAAKCIGMTIGYCRRAERREYVENVLKLSDPFGYFNSGVMVLNLTMIREHFTCKEILEMATEREWMFCDQCLLNVLFQGRVLYLPQEWNVLCPSHNLENERDLPPELFEEYSHAHKAPKIFHYAGDKFPFKHPTVDGADYFWKYAMNSPFINTFFEQLEKNSREWLNNYNKNKNNVVQQNPQVSFSNAQPESSGWKKMVKKVFPYGSSGYIALKKVFFKLRRRPYDPIVDIINSKILAKDEQRIKIFVSRRIDVNSIPINNHVFQDVRCGAVYDIPSLYLGDDTGENISDLRIQFGELTVMYHAWKNEDADYFGLCHYRRFPVFTSGKSSVIEQGCIVEDNLDKKTIKKYSLDNKRLYERKIPEADIWVSGAMNIDEMTSLDAMKKAQHGAKLVNVYGVFMLNTPLYLPTMPLVTLKLVEDMFPQYYEAAKAYLNGCRYYAYNCFVMKKSLFNQFCEFVFPVLLELNKRYDFSRAKGLHARTPGYMAEMLYGIFVHWAIQNGYAVKETPLVFFKNTEPSPVKTLKTKMGDSIHKIRWKNSRLYRAVFMLDQRVSDIQRITDKIDLSAINGGRSKRDKVSLTANVNLEIACLANQIHEYHKAAFSEFRNCYTGGAIAIIASGPTAKYYSQILGIPHIGMNASFTIPGIKLDYYFATDFKEKPVWSEQLKNNDFIKFFGQYSSGLYRPAFQASEQLIRENNGRRFFQAAPNEEIHYDIEYYPLMGFYTIALQAIQFALFTNAKRIYLVGCDCTLSGYFDGTNQTAANINAWEKGYTKMKAFAEQFYPETDIISINPCGLKGMFHDVYTENFLDDHPEINRKLCEIVDLNTIEEEMEKNA